MRSTITTALAILLGLMIGMNTSLLAQAKVGTTGAGFLDFPYSAVESALGGCGTTIIGDQAGRFNPGALALYYSDRRASASFVIPHNIIGDVDIYSGSIGARLYQSQADEGETVLTLAIAYNIIAVRTDWNPVITYDIGTIGGDELTFQADNTAHYFSAGLAWESEFRVGVGFGIVIIDENYFDAGATSRALNFGLLVDRTFPLSSGEPFMNGYQLTPGFGLAFLNLGPDIKMISQEYSLPQQTNIGASLKLDNYHNGFSSWSLMTCLERHADIVLDKTTYRAGTELGLFDALFLRYGRHETVNDTRATWGGELNLSGFINTLARWNRSGSDVTDSGFFKRFEIRYAYGKREFGFVDHPGNHMISISWR